MDDKFAIYYTIVDIFDLEKKNDITYHDFEDFDDADYLKFFVPFDMSILMRYLEYILYKICDNKKEKEKVLMEIKTLYEENINSKDYKWKDISLSELMKGEFNYLKEKFIVRKNYIPDISYFINNYSYY